MKQVININFQGRVVPIEVSAFDLLKSYTESLGRHFANEEGKDEIINDIESRIGELFQERLSKGATCITDDDVNAIIKSMGRPEDFEPMDDAQSSASSATGSSESNDQSSSSSTATPTGKRRLYRDENDKVLGGVCSGLANYFNVDVVVTRIIFVILLFSGIGFLTYIIMWVAVPSSATTQIGSTRKKLFRDPDEKKIAGVCSGIGHYFGINPWIPRVLFLLPFISFVSKWGHWGGFWNFGDFMRFTFSPTSLIIYIILWIVIPEALTTSEKLEMKGEKVDMNSIKASVMEEMKTVGKKAEKFGKEASSVINQKAGEVASDVKNFSKRNRSGLGNVIAMIAKIFAYFIIGCVGFALVMGLFALAVMSIGLFPLKDFVINNGSYQNLFAWGTLLFFIAVPIVGIITWIIRKIAGSKSRGNMLGFSFGALWVIGWVCVIFLISSISRDFKYNSKNMTEQEIVLSNPTVNKLELTSYKPLDKYRKNRFFRIEPFAGIDDDTAYVNNVEVRILKSDNDSFRVTAIKMATGRSRSIAENNAAAIQYSGVQKDSVLILDKGISINKTDKFRNQHVLLTVYVPVGKKILIDKSIGWYSNVHIGNDWNDDWYYDEDNDNEWSSGIEYTMKADGKLYSANGEPAKRNGRSTIIINSNGVEVITNDGDNSNSGNTDNYRYNANDNPVNKLDSLKSKLEKEKEYLKDSLKKAKDKIEQQLNKIGGEEEPLPLSSTRLPVFGPVMSIY
ncbi:MAG: PspC domain-containing protein [Ferruginibacter sp.]|nr:PspC domain-containing protein [Bacteroidota bacterium]MBX2917982.1 PspC domain-containing protein [Ferruginibacter sp.]MCC7378231.1 PspC domain-containing protein [Chitinophagaceae bacterium]